MSTVSRLSFITGTRLSWINSKSITTVYITLCDIDEDTITLIVSCTVEFAPTKLPTFLLVGVEIFLSFIDLISPAKIWSAEERGGGDERSEDHNKTCLSGS